MLTYNTPDKILAFSTTSDGIVDAEIGNAPIFMPHQTHGIEVRRIDADFLAKNSLQQAVSLQGVDALCTDMPNVIVSVKTADCIPVLLYTDKVVAAVHAGWRGTNQRIVEHTIDTLVSTYGVKPEELCAIIGPGISLDSFEVGDEVYDAFAASHYPMDRIAERRAKWHIDLWECNRLQLISKGVLPGNVTIAGICTVKQNDRFYSARAHGSRTGRIINGIMIR